MIYFNGERWMPFENIISFTEKMVVFDNDTERYKGKKDLQITTFKLSIEEAKRLEDIKNVTTMSIVDIEKYIKGEPMLEEQSAEMQEALQKAVEKKSIREAINFETVPDETLLTLDFLKKEFKEGILIEKNDLVSFEGSLYLSLQDHIADGNYPPGKTNYRYVIKRKGTNGDGEEPDLWERPTGYENVYSKGDRVKYFDGLIYVSKIDGNAEEPTKDEPYNRYWEKES